MRFMKRLKLTIATLALCLGLTVAVVPSMALADSPVSTACGALGSNSSCTSQPSEGVSLNKVIKSIVNILSLFIGIASVIMIMIGGFNFVTSGGDSSKVTTAKNTIIYAIVGLVIVALAQFIVQFVLRHV